MTPETTTPKAKKPPTAKAKKKKAKKNTLPRLTALEAANGWHYIALREIAAISGPFQKYQFAPSRAVTRKGGAQIYILDTEDNGRRLAPLLPVEAPIQTVAKKKAATAGGKANLGSQASSKGQPQGHGG